jgi:hypothetical protein
MPEPRWIGNALVADCRICADRKRPGARYDDGSGVCGACGGATYIVLAERKCPEPPATATAPQHVAEGRLRRERDYYREVLKEVVGWLCSDFDGRAHALLIAQNALDVAPDDEAEAAGR